ncbi:hypothetical protein Zm00014a_002110, partial [Zea mays]
LYCTYISKTTFLKYKNISVKELGRT